MFAAAAQVPRLMQELEQGPLSQYTPCRMSSATLGDGPQLRTHGRGVPAGHSANVEIGGQDFFLTKFYAATACFCTRLEERPNSLDGGRCGDGPDYRPIPDFTIA